MWPEPNSSAAGSRMLQLIECFKQADYQVTFVSAAQRTEHMVDLDALHIEHHDIVLNSDCFDEFINGLNPDVVMFDRYMVEEQFGWRVAKQCPNAIRILDTEDLQSLRNARHEQVKKGLDVNQANLHTELAIREVSAILRCDLSIMISQAEIDLLVSAYQVPISHLLYLPFIYQESQFKAQLLPYHQRQDFISIGNFRHAPNWDAVLQLKQVIWPKIRKQLPDANLRVYGAYPPKKATELHNPKQGFYVEGWAKDAFEVIEQSKVLLAPLRFGAGLKGKLAEAMLLGTPSVTTEIGAEGMKSDSLWPGVIADDNESFVKGAVTLYQQESCWQQSHLLAQPHAKRLFGQPELMESLIGDVEHISAQLEQHRNGNFVGLMLNHHSHRSTQFMSQWITSKNKLAQLQSEQSSSSL